MAEWRLLRGWTSETLKARLESLPARALNFDEAEHEMTGDAGWQHYHSEAVIARETEGDAMFERARAAIEMVADFFAGNLGCGHRRTPVRAGRSSKTKSPPDARG